MDGLMGEEDEGAEQDREPQKMAGRGQSQHEGDSDDGNKRRGFSILVSHSARGEATAFQCRLHSLPVCRKHPEDTAGTQKHKLMSNQRKCQTVKKELLLLWCLG